MKVILTIAAILFSLTGTIAQPKRASVVIGSMTTRPNALLIINPQYSNQGVLLPQLSTGQRLSIKPSSPDENGLIVFDKNQKAFYYWSDSEWLKLENEQATTRTFQNIDPACFRSLNTDHNALDGMAIFDSDNTFVTVVDAARSQALITPVNLPHHATLREVKVHYMDNDDGNLSVMLIRKNVWGGTAQLIDWLSAGADGYIKTQTFNSFNGMGQIDLENYSYRLIVRFDLDDGEIIDTPEQAKQRLYGITLEYEQ